MTQQITHQPADFICLCGRHSATMALHNYHQSKCPGVLAGQGSTPATETAVTYSAPTPEPVTDVSPWVFTA